jgi:hypothetical protein
MKTFCCLMVLFFAFASQAQDGDVVEVARVNQVTGEDISQQNNLTCSALDLSVNGQDLGSYGKCFVLDLFVSLDFSKYQFSIDGNYGRKPCGGWPPYFEGTAGTIVDQGDGAYALNVPSGSEGPGYLAHLTIKNLTAQYSGPEGNYVLSCKPSS